MVSLMLKVRVRARLQVKFGVKVRLRARVKLRLRVGVFFMFENNFWGYIPPFHLPVILRFFISTSYQNFDPL